MPSNFSRLGLCLGAAALLFCSQGLWPLVLVLVLDYLVSSYFLAVPCGLQDFSSLTKYLPPAVEARSPHHWATRELPECWI